MTPLNYDPSQILPLIKQSFPPTNGNYTLQIHKEPQDITSFFALVETNLHEFYHSQHGPAWADDKLKEMREVGLVYVSYIDAGRVIGFISFLDTWDSGRVLYLYEIHVHPEYQGQGLGKVLIDSFHNLAHELSEQQFFENSSDVYADRKGKVLKGTRLTVFSENKVLKWYESLGYVLSDDSPKDKKLRSGKIIKPDYYLLYRSVR